MLRAVRIGIFDIRLNIQNGLLDAGIRILCIFQIFQLGARMTSAVAAVVIATIQHNTASPENLIDQTNLQLGIGNIL